MKTQLKPSVFSVAIAIAAGLLVLLGYFFDVPTLVNLRIVFTRWAVVLASVALLVGVANLGRVHWGKIRRRESGAFYSSILLLSMVITFLVVGFFNPASSWALWIFDSIQVPVEASLMAILAVILTIALIRLIKRRFTIFTAVFFLTFFLVLLGAIAIPGFDIPGMREARTWIMQVWAVAGARGILLGVALGTVATGLRILTGSDRPYGG